MNLTHLNKENNPTMVDISTKNITKRTAIARGKIYMNEEAFNAAKLDKTKKGSVINTAIIAGIMGAKKTSNIIPLCHNINLTSIDINITPSENEYAFIVESSANCDGKTGVEMESLTATSIALLCMYDMLKAIDKGMKITDICLIKKTGGKSGDFLRKDSQF